MSDDLGKKLVIAGASAIIGVTLNKVAKTNWQKIYGEDPPTTNPSEEINWKKVMIWSVITGTLVGSAKLATKRYLTLKLNA